MAEDYGWRASYVTLDHRIACRAHRWPPRPVSGQRDRHPLWSATLTGHNESPPNARPGIGTADVVIDTVANTMSIAVTFSGLTGGDIASHIHCCTATPGTGTAGVATDHPADLHCWIPRLGVTAGTYNHVPRSDRRRYSTTRPSSPPTAASPPQNRCALLTGIARRARPDLNIHTPGNPTGEIRGFLAVVPEPATWAMMIVGFGLMGLAMRRRQARPFA